MAKPNYSFEKRRKEQERKSKKQQKVARKSMKTDSAEEGGSGEAEATPTANG